MRLPFPTSTLPLRAVPLLACAALLAAGPARAQAVGGDDESLRGFVARQVAALHPEATRFDVQLGSVERAALAPCRRAEPFLPASARLWGRSSLGLRCTDGATWSVLVPVTVRLWGPALVAAAPLAAGSLPQAQDVQEQEIELTHEGSSVLHDASQVAGRQLVRPVAPGQALHAEMFRLPQVVQAGDPVRLRIQGQGFVLTASGQALGSAAEGQPVRVRSELGRVLSGTAHEGRTVDVPL